MAEERSLQEQLEEIGAPLDWVRGYLGPGPTEGTPRRARGGARTARILGRPAARGSGLGRACAPRASPRALRQAAARVRRRPRAARARRGSRRRGRAGARTTRSGARAAAGGRALLR